MMWHRAEPLIRVQWTSRSVDLWLRRQTHKLSAHACNAFCIAVQADHSVVQSGRRADTKSVGAHASELRGQLQPASDRCSSILGLASVEVLMQLMMNVLTTTVRHRFVLWKHSSCRFTASADECRPASDTWSSGNVPTAERKCKVCTESKRSTCSEHPNRHADDSCDAPPKAVMELAAVESGLF